MYTTENLVEGKSVNAKPRVPNYNREKRQKILKLCELPLSSVFHSVSIHNAQLDLLDSNWVTTVNTILGREGGIFQTERNKPNNKTDLAIKSTNSAITINQ